MIRKGLLAAAPLLAALIVTLGATRAYAIPKFVETGQPQDITAGLMGNVGNIQVLFTSNPGDVEGDDALTYIFRANGKSQTVAGTESGAALFLNIDGTPLTRNQYNGLNALGPESLFSSVILVEGADGSGWSDTVNVFLNGGGTGVRLMFVSDRAGATGTPELSSWALLTIGIGALTLALCRRDIFSSPDLLPVQRTFSREFSHLGSRCALMRVRKSMEEML